ncbi:MAG: Ig-like domain-containing protein [Verrucomicrobiales bacterium]|nr:Ig-like domain-containing protein [Verrucomicrobiales bacterium]
MKTPHVFPDSGRNSTMLQKCCTAAKLVLEGTVPAMRRLGNTCPPKRGKAATYAFVAYFMFSSQLGFAANPFFGFAGHPWGPYATNVVPTLDLVQQAGAGLYRVDLGTKYYDLTDRLLPAAQSRDIKLIAILFGTPGDYTASYNEGFAFAKKYAGKIRYYQVSNERDVWTGKATIADGQLPTEFDDVKYAQAKTEIKGLIDGIKAGDPNAKTIVNFTWLHYGFIQRLVDDGINFDILGIDWYWGDVINVKGMNLPEYLKTQFHKPLWVTEGNRWEGSTGGNETTQADYISKTLKGMHANPNISAYIIYELLDEPAAVGFEQNMGLVYNFTSPKPSFEVYKQIIAGSAVRTFDVQAPVVSITAPANSATISMSSVTLSANASDNAGVAGVQFKLDGVNLGAEDANPPYSIVWNTAKLTNGSHSITAVARDAAGNTTTSAGVNVTISIKE